MVIELHVWGTKPNRKTQVVLDYQEIYDPSQLSYFDGNYELVENLQKPVDQVRQQAKGL